MPAAKKEKKPIEAYFPELRCGACHSKMYWSSKTTVKCGKLGCRNRGIDCEIPKITLKPVASKSD